MSKYETWKICLPLKISMLVFKQEVVKWEQFARFRSQAGVTGLVTLPVRSKKANIFSGERGERKDICNFQK